MIKVGFIISLENSGDWSGGINYFKNLFLSLEFLGKNAISPVIITSDKGGALQEIFPQIKILRTESVRPFSTYWFFGRVLKILLKKDPIFEMFLKKNNIRLISHSGPLGKNSKIPSLPWIPDFQELHYPSFFSSKELQRRKFKTFNSLQQGSLLLLSSNSALSDLKLIAPEHSNKARVLNFFTILPPINKLPSTLQLQKKYNLSEPYLFLPNQYWIHKNHTVVCKAISILKKKGIKIQVISSGNTKDHRHIEYFSNFSNLIDSLNIRDHYRILGPIPYDDVLGLMLNSLAVINPSLFEGWSTSVEESKAMNKPIILSNISTHLEQNPEKGIYFDPNNEFDLADKFIAFLESSENDSESRNEKKYSQKYINNLEVFAFNFNRIVAECLEI
jgi:glycosyltransferase involved in cell wall biosynthesis